MSRLFYALAVGLVGAVIVHVAIVLLLPGLGAQGAWSRVAAALPPERLMRTDAPGMKVFPPDDPFFLTAVCRFGLEKGPIRLGAAGQAAAWFVAAYAPDGRILASLNDRMVPGGGLDILVLTPEQLNQRPPSGDDGVQPYAVETPPDAALLALRVFVPDPTFRPSAEEFLRSAACGPAAR